MHKQQLDAWCRELLRALQREFGGRLCFFGLQGSYARGEATEQSDIDLVVLFNRLDTETLARYRALLGEQPEHEKACGFVSDEPTLAHWPGHDLLSLVYDTRPFYGTLEHYRRRLSEKNARDALRIGAADLYHAACHSRLFADVPARSLPALYKSAFFVLRLAAFVRCGTFAPDKQALMPLLTSEELRILQACQAGSALAEAEDARTDALYAQLIAWCGALIRQSEK